MNNSRLIKISKYLSKHLRHQPERIGIKLAPGGWVSIDELLRACKKHSFEINRTELEEVVANNDKKRFSFDSTGTLIRANQGHSVEVDLQLEPVIPPKVLYHGTGHRAVEVILQQGLRKMSRHHVHLSSEMITARKVGARHGRPVILIVDAAGMQNDGYTFYCSDNGVWLVDNVPPKYLQQTEIGGRRQEAGGRRQEAGGRR
ncbi:MAG: RNA 2'-phosphotransferase [Symploca sp. SIO2C1]|nr:RNA 2'-phosphotransferase [Symploca sp. SIO2C1]